MAQITVRLADPAGKLPLPGMEGVYAPAGTFLVDPGQPYWSQALADGSLVRVVDEPAATTTDKPKK